MCWFICQASDTSFSTLKGRNWRKRGKGIYRLFLTIWSEALATLIPHKLKSCGASEAEVTDKKIVTDILNASNAAVDEGIILGDFLILQDDLGFDTARGFFSSLYPSL
ncbi:hypothetical protein ACET3Z_000047 [Daucus carota]